jgi:hypothetical protein
MSLAKCLNRNKWHTASTIWLGLLLPILASSQQVLHGHVEHNTYIDERFGLRYTFPNNLVIQTSYNGMSVGTGEKQGVSEFLFSAMEQPSGHVRDGVFVVADPTNAFGSANAAQYLHQIIALSMHPSASFDTRTVILAGRVFARADVGVDGPVHIYGAQYATVCGSHYISFYFSGASQSVIDELVKSFDTMELTCPKAGR